MQKLTNMPIIDFDKLQKIEKELIKSNSVISLDLLLEFINTIKKMINDNIDMLSADLPPNVSLAVNSLIELGVINIDKITIAKRTNDDIVQQLNS